MPAQVVDQKSGAILFKLTSEERTVANLKAELQQELNEIQALKTELQQLKDEMKGGQV
ncbi:hypothetical protein IC620_09465 [Hazenella sp. IB182357]|uniref:Uncharacterized protein n=1 Tax=Polycladospora coralii TaxID=2771432 RepID=A0A926N6P4_9BACL|nr:hypothetical protein [Polycladospora coralii]MBD1372581.1 hypothetical protein [Polycladospora coralii]